MNVFLPERLTSFLFVYCIFGLVISAFVSLQIFWTDSEMWPQSTARYLWDFNSTHDFFVKPLFNFLLWLSYKIAIWSDTFPLNISRGLMVLNLAAILVLVFRIVKKITQNELLAIATALLLLTAITTLEQATRVRSDLVVCMLNLFTLDLILRKGPRDVRVWIPALISLLITPKAVYWLLALVPFLPRIQTWPKKTIKKTVLIIVPLLLIFLAFRYQTIYSVAHYYFSSFTRAGSGISYFNLLRLEHVVNAIQKDILIWFLIFVRLLWVRSFKGFDAMFLILLAALIIHPERMPFFIVSLLPFYLLIAVSHPAIADSFRKLQLRGGWIFLISLALFCSFGLHRFIKRAEFLLENHNNNMQKQAVTLIQNYIEKTPDVTIYDPAGIIYSVPTFDWYVGPGEIENNLRVMESLKEKKPNIILYTLRVMWLEPAIYDFLKSEYVNLGGGVYARFPFIPLKEKQRTLKPEDILAAIPFEKVIDNPENPVRLFVFNKQNVLISNQGAWIFDGLPKLSLDEEITFHALQTSVEDIQLPPQTQTVRVSFWSNFDYPLPDPLTILFRFDPEL